MFNPCLKNVHISKFLSRLKRHCFGDITSFVGCSNCQHLKRVELFDCQLITKAGTRKLRVTIAYVIICVLSVFLLPVPLILMITYRTKQLPFTLFNLQVLSGCFFFAFLPFIMCCQPLITCFQFIHHVLSAHLSSACTYSWFICYHGLSTHVSLVSIYLYCAVSPLASV